VAAASANRVGDSHGPPAWAGGSVIAAPEYPGFPVTLAAAGAEEELISAVIDFASVAQWYDVLPWREWRAGPQLPVTALIGDELTALANPRAHPPSP
jgi:predicted amidohydrolase